MDETKIYTQQEIKEMLKTNDIAVRHGIVAIWKCQTAHEKLAYTTTEKNGIGFNAFDAQFLTSLAEQVEFKNRTLSPKQITYARKAILKYAGQLTRIANHEIVIN